MSDSIETRLKRYTERHPQEVILVSAEIAGESDEILIFKGVSSSLVRPTAPDPDIPILSPDAKLLSIDRLASPYTPDRPRYIQRGLSWSEMEQILADAGV